MKKSAKRKPRPEEIIWPCSPCPSGRMPSLRELKETEREEHPCEEHPAWSLFDQHASTGSAAWLLSQRLIDALDTPSLLRA